MKINLPAARSIEENVPKNQDADIKTLQKSSFANSFSSPSKKIRIP